MARKIGYEQLNKYEKAVYEIFVKAFQLMLTALIVMLSVKMWMQLGMPIIKNRWVIIHMSIFA